MKCKLAVLIWGAVVMADANAIPQEKLMYLCGDVIQLDTTLALQSLQSSGHKVDTLNYYLERFRLTEEQVAPVIERYKKNPGDARLMVQYPPHADRYYLENCQSDPARFIPNYENLKAVYK